MKNTEQLVIEWAADKGIIAPENAKNQCLKMASEAGEVCDAVLKGTDTEAIKLEIGDVLVTLAILAKQNDFDLETCFAAAYQKIKNRQGKTVNGTFIKE